ncbi:MAG TPA: hypothetical protein PKL34_06585 [Candidatus Cloacimonadota bacterium]|nr:hypothetical protein [Candidatus Cloacimonadota bacterium]HPN40690.1 hypothetical protein [Candidatus Cloacimonadota bacterium]
MNVIIDVLGSVIIGSMLLLMMITFQYGMRESADRALYTKEMINNMDTAATKLNAVIALAGIGFDPGATVIYAAQDSLVFRTYWDYQNDRLGFTINTLSIRLANLPSPYGRALTIRQNNVPLNDLGYIFWIDGLQFKYYDRNGALTTQATSVRSAESWLTFFRNPPRADGRVLRSRLQVRCYFMNAYMRGA